MELVLKLPKDKPPFIGVLFNTPYMAASTNQSLITEYKHCTYSIELEPVQNKINLHLHCKEQMLTKLYDFLDFNPEKLKQWLNYSKDFKTFNFAHLLINKARHEVSRSNDNKQLFVLKVHKVEMLLPM